MSGTSDTIRVVIPLTILKRLESERATLQALPERRSCDYEDVTVRASPRSRS